MESYVERFAREQKEKAQKESRKSQNVKEVQKDGTDTRSEGHEAQEDSSSGQ